MTAQPASLAMVFFRVGDVRFAIEASAVTAMLPMQPDIPAFATVMELTPGSAPRRVLSLRSAGGVQSYVVEEPVETGDLAVQSIHPLPGLLAARLRIPQIRALAWDDQGLTVLVALS